MGGTAVGGTDVAVGAAVGGTWVGGTDVGDGGGGGTVGGTGALVGAGNGVGGTGVAGAEHAAVIAAARTKTIASTMSFLTISSFSELQPG